ncbi:phosphonate metabolism transcriptional regulator PhnF [Agaricicola taiwanensis]|uniref:phosphonate metabolism transcriptional regulator PhnF n=1 Tax=Agaricicola taiwanensis TaxID=591372 RepID=UPI00166AA3F6|nr:phosphonate metabolism transcriptional regulator PhnF [Agaricicola taiwanensis]
MNGTDDGISRWRRVADGIREWVRDGSITDQLPPEVELAARFGVNRHTVRRAIAALTAEGLLRAERGRGTFLNAVAPRIIYPVGERARFSESMVQQSLEPRGRLIKAERVAAKSSVAALLDCRPGTPLHRLERLAVVEGMPLSRSTSYFVAERFPDIISAYAETGSVTEALRRHGVTDYRRRETRITATRISAGDAEYLNCTSDSIVLVSNAIDVDLEGKPVQAIRTRFLADRMELVFAAS